MKKLAFACSLSVLCSTAVAAQSNLSLFKAMFANMVVKKNIQLCSTYYAKDFQLYTNGIKQNYQQFCDGHKKIYATSIQYKVRYDDETFVDHNNRVAGRMWISVKHPGKPWSKIQVIVIAKYNAGKISKLWELTYPNWAKMKTFKKLAK